MNSNFLLLNAHCCMIFDDRDVFVSKEGTVARYSRDPWNRTLWDFCTVRKRQDCEWLPNRKAGHDRDQYLRAGRLVLVALKLSLTVAEARSVVSVLMMKGRATKDGNGWKKHG